MELLKFYIKVLTKHKKYDKIYKEARKGGAGVCGMK